MTRARVQTVIVILLLLAFLGLWAMTRQTTQPMAPIRPTDLPPAAAPLPPPLSEPSQPPEPTSSPELVPDIQRDPFDLPELLKEELRRKKREKEEELRHRNERPTAPVEPTVVQPPPLTLQGIFWGTPRPQALINRRILSVGDTIDGAEVLAINREGVTVSFQGEQLFLKLPLLSSQNAFRSSFEAQSSGTQGTKGGPSLE